MTTKKQTVNELNLKHNTKKLREKTRIVAQALIETDNETITLHSDVMDLVEQVLIEVAMETRNNNQSKAAMLLGFNRATLRSRQKKYGMI